MRWGLSQRDLATILGISESALSLCETQERPPTVNLLIGTEVIFGQSVREAFPALYAQTERNVMRRAAAFSKRLEHESDGTAKMKRELLNGMIDRSEVDNKYL